MINDWFCTRKFDLPFESIDQIPRHPAYRYEFYNNQLVIRGRPRFFHCLLNLSSGSNPDFPVDTVDETAADLQISPWRPEDCSRLQPAFLSAFSQSAPLQYLPHEERESAAAAMLEATARGDDGPFVGSASFVLRQSHSSDLLGAILVTLIPDADLTTFERQEWDVDVPPDAVEQGWGQPHLTWVFVAPAAARQGWGRRLLAKTEKALSSRGYDRLASTFLLGNDASMLWHWKMGFQLLSQPGSR